ncbi:MAG: bifunctional oligoribonuclease/PAP phosphatase NrnA [Bacilli bacterium]|nr:bifunctional oligoribonuclease/PAP phosphatase NrnA [Bacilli bacterium]
MILQNRKENKMKEKILEKIKEFNTIVISRHIGADPDALGASIGLKHLILDNFPKKKVYVIGVYASKFKSMGKLDNIDNLDTSNALLFVLDTPNLIRIDGISNINDFKYVIKIDHHPTIDKFGDISWVDTKESSVCQMILSFAYDNNLKVGKEASEKFFTGIVSDTGRFLYDYTTPKTYELVSKLLSDHKINTTEIFNMLYSRSLEEVRLQGYIEENMTVTDNGFAYIILTDDIIKKYGDDTSYPGDIVSNLNNIDEVIVWSIFTYDVKNDLVKVNVRSRGPVISHILENYGGGGHALASGVRLKDDSKVKNIIKDLDKVCMEYNKAND